MNKVLFLSCYEDEMFKSFISSGRFFSQAAQKFDKLIVKGFVHNGYTVDAIAFLSGDTSVSCIGQEDYHNSLIQYHYCYLSGNVLKRAAMKKQHIIRTFTEWYSESDNCLVVIDALKPGALELSKIAREHGVRVITVITDFLDFLLDAQGSLINRIKNRMLFCNFYKQFDFTTTFVLLTEDMKERIKIHNRKYIVMEGLCDIDCLDNADQSMNCLEHHQNFVYSGAISKQFGIDRLVKAFIDANLSGYELHLYGNGDYCPELVQIQKEHPNVKYYGTVINEQMIEIQKSAFCLVNPRPVADEYTKYSFPSKTIEYMISGRPVLTTHLPGIPKDYDDYLVYFESDDPNGIKKGLIDMTLRDSASLNDLGDNARRFILMDKNNKLQIAKLLNCL